MRSPVTSKERHFGEAVGFDYTPTQCVYRQTMGDHDMVLETWAYLISKLAIVQPSAVGTRGGPVRSSNELRDLCERLRFYSWEVAMASAFSAAEKGI